MIIRFFEDAISGVGDFHPYGMRVSILTPLDSEESLLEVHELTQRIVRELPAVDFVRLHGSSVHQCIDGISDFLESCRCRICHGSIVRHWLGVCRGSMMSGGKLP